jgi:hypothetical protein
VEKYKRWGVGIYGVEGTEEWKNTLAEQPRRKTSKHSLDGRNPSLEGYDRKGISLSGLLNVIDGVASHEGTYYDDK